MVVARHPRLRGRHPSGGRGPITPSGPPREADIGDLVALATSVVVATGTTFLAFQFLLPKLIEQGLNIAAQRRQQEHERELEQLRALLTERHTQFAGFVAKRLDVIAGLYERISRAETAVADLIAAFKPAGSASDEERARIAAKVGNDFTVYFRANEIFLDHDVAQAVEGFAVILNSAYRNYSYTLTTEREGTGPLRGKALEAAFTKITEEAPRARATIRDQFRRIVGAQVAADPNVAGVLPRQGA